MCWPMVPCAMRKPANPSSASRSLISSFIVSAGSRNIRPAERFELMVQNLYGLANDGKSNAKGVARPLPLALFAREFRREGEFVRPPRLVQRLVFGVLAPLARARGYKAVNPEYMGPAGRAAARPKTVRPSARGARAPARSSSPDA